MAKRNTDSDSSEAIASLKWRINNLVKNTRNQQSLETLLHMKRDLIERKTTDLEMFHSELVEYESQMLSFDAIKERFDKVYKNLTQALQFIENISQVAPHAFPIFDKANQYMETMKNMLISIPDFDSMKRDDYKDYLDLLHRLEDWLIDYSMYVKKMENTIKDQVIKSQEAVQS